MPRGNVFAEESINELDRVLIATDGSDRASVATHLAASLRWPKQTRIAVVEVMPPLFPGVETPGPSLTYLDKLERERIDRDLAEARDVLAKTGACVEVESRTGRVATEVVAAALAFGADLVIVGSRGRGPITSLLLGSIAAEAIDHAPCAVLVARRPTIRRMVVAEDGSATAGLAVKLATTWPLFRGIPTRAVSVAPVTAIIGLGPIRHEAANEMHAEAVDALRAKHDLFARDCARELTDAGVPATPEIRFGDPAAELVAGAIESDADLIILGTRGQSGLERLLLGSVARNVLTHSPTSVLVVPPEHRRTRG